MEKIDRRIERTHSLLRDALIALTLENGYEAVTIRQITERANVGYATFFRHYSDKEALLGDVLRVMKDDLMRLLAPQSMITAPVETGALLFRYVQEHSDLCRVLLESTDIGSLLMLVREFGQQDAAPLLRQGSARMITPDLAADHLVSSLVLLLRWWLDHDLPYSPEQMGEIAAQLIIQPVIDAFMPSSGKAPGADAGIPAFPV